MTNEELEKIVDPKERFSLLRKEIIEESCKQEKERNIDVRNFVLDCLENDGFNISEKGTQYIASIITLFYHERKLYSDYTTPEISYDAYDLNLDNLNDEYFQLRYGKNKREVLADTYKSILEDVKKDKRRPWLLDENYWDLSDYNNDHFKMVGKDKNEVLVDIFRSLINNTEKETWPINDMVYEIADYTISHYNRDEKTEKYQKISEQKEQKTL